MLMVQESITKNRVAAVNCSIYHVSGLSATTIAYSKRYF